MKTSPIIINRSDVFGEVRFDGSVRLSILLHEHDNQPLQAHYLFRSRKPRHVYSEAILWQDDEGCEVAINSTGSKYTKRNVWVSFVNPRGKKIVPFIKVNHEQRLVNFYDFAQDMAALVADRLLTPHRVARTTLCYFPSHRPTVEYLDLYDQYQSINGMFSQLRKNAPKVETNMGPYRYGLGVFSGVNTEYLQALQKAEDKMRSNLPRVVRTWLKGKNW